MDDQMLLGPCAKIPSGSQIVEWIHFKCHHATRTVLQARERETVVEITLTWPHRHEWVATGGASCKKEDDWDASFGVVLATQRAIEDLQIQIAAWRLGQSIERINGILKKLCQAVPPDPPAKPTELYRGEWLATDDPANYDVTFNRGSNEQVVAR